MALDAKLTPNAIRHHIAENSKMRACDLADQLGIVEAALVAAKGARRITAAPDAIMPALTACGPVVGLSRNRPQ